MIELTHDSDFAISNDEWLVKTEKIHLPSQTDTTIKGYGGISFMVTVNSKFYSYDQLEVILRRDGYEYKSMLDINNRCILVPFGGNFKNYIIKINRVENESQSEVE